MELSEVGRRIFGQHWRLILFCIFFVLVVIGFVSLVRGGSQTYTASTRLVLDNQDPKSRSESTSIADTGKAIATSPAQVRAALNDVHVTTRDPLDVAEHHVSIQALGTSAVLELSVSDRNPRVAAAVSNALAARVIKARLDVSNGQLERVLSDLEQRNDDLNRRIANVDAHIDSLNIQLANAGTAASANAFRAERDTATRSRDFLAQQRGVVESERVSLLSTDAFRPKPSIISPATVPEAADASRWVSYVLLGTLLGLILGVGWAGVTEVIRPTLVGSDVLARELDTPLLGTLSREPNADASKDPSNLPAISAGIWLVAEAAGVETVGLFPAVPGLHLSRFADQLEEIPPGALAPQLSAGAIDQARPGLLIRPFSVHDRSADVQAVVMVAPTEMKKSQLVEMSQLLILMQVPLLGLVTYAPQRSRDRIEAWTQVFQTRAADHDPSTPST